MKQIQSPIESLPGGEKLYAGHATQAAMLVRPHSLKKVPAGHSLQSSGPSFSSLSEYLPNGQSKQIVPPWIAEYLPFSQPRQRDSEPMPGTFENLPKGHKTQVADEFCRVAVEYVPATHSLQSLRLNMPGTLDHEPAGHDKQYEIFGAATPGEYEPAGQSTQSDGNVNGNFHGLEYLPDAQLRHVVMDVAREALE